MAAPKVRCDYEALSQVAQTFSQQANEAQVTLRQLRGTMGVLQAGDWIGQGAAAFYQEMDGQVLPTLQRLVRALETAAQTTSQISQNIKQAEDEAARVLRGPNGASGSSAVGGSGPVMGVASGGGAGTGPAGASSFTNAGDGGGASGPAAAGPGSGGGSGSGGTGGSGSAGKPPDTPMFSSLDPKVAELVDKSPTLTAQLKALEAQGWTMDTVPLAKSSVLVNGQTKHLILDSHLTPVQQVGMLAQTAASLNPPHIANIVPNANMSRDEFVRAQTSEHLLEPGNVYLNIAAVHAELVSHGGIEIGWPAGMTHDDQVQMEHINQQLQSNSISRDQALQMAGSVFGGVTEPGAKVNNWEARAAALRKYWDEHAADNGWGANR